MLIESVKRYESALKRHQNASEPINIIIEQYQELRDKQIELLLDYLLEHGDKNAIKNYIAQIDMSAAA